MEIYRIEVMPIGTNCYLVYDKETKEGIVIDPGGSPELIKKAIDQLGINIKVIINTHGHWDHVGANRAIKEKTGAPVYIHEADQDYLTDPKYNMSSMMGTQTTTDPADGLLHEDDLVHFGNCTLKVLHTPGHTPGGISLYGHNAVFCGDTLFYRSIGRTDLPGGSYRHLIDSIREKLFSLPGETLVCPGHGIMSRIDEEESGNPFIR